MLAAEVKLGMAARRSWL